MEYITGEHRTQNILFPDLLDNYVTQENPTRVIDAYVDSLDLKNLGFILSEAQTGRPPYNPTDLLKLYIYGYLNKIRSSRKLEQETKRNLELMWLLKKLTPDHKTIARFRHDNPQALKNTFKDFIRLCIKLDLYGKELVAIDGSKFKADNSKNRNITKNKLVNRIAQLDAKIDAINKEMDTCDQKENVAEEKAEKTNNKKSTQETRAILNQHLAELHRQKTAYQEHIKELEQTGESQKSLTDPDSRLMKQANGNSDVCYNIQTAVDAKNKLVVDFEVTNAPNDFNQLSGMAKKALETLKVNRLSAVADAGFDSATDIANCLMQGVSVHIAGAKEFDVCVPCSKEEAQTGVSSHVSGRCVYVAERNLVLCPMGQVLYPGCYSKKSKEASFYNFRVCKNCVCKCVKNKLSRSFAMVMREEEFSRVYDESGLFVRQVRVRSDKDVVLLRKSLVEHPFGVLKRVMDMGYCLLRGFDLVRGEFSLAFLAYNLKRAINLVGVPKLIQTIQA